MRVEAILSSDSAGITRKYKVTAGSEDSFGEVTYYYDAHGVVRFAFATKNAIIGTRREDRAYYDSAGKLLFKSSRLIAGPEYGEFDAEPIRDPAADFSALCGNAK